MSIAWIDCCCSFPAPTLLRSRPEPKTCFMIIASCISSTPSTHPTRFTACVVLLSYVRRHDVALLIPPLGDHRVNGVDGQRLLLLSGSSPGDFINLTSRKSACIQTGDKRDCAAILTTCYPSSTNPTRSFVIPDPAFPLKRHRVLHLGDMVLLGGSGETHTCNRVVEVETMGSLPRNKRLALTCNAFFHSADTVVFTRATRDGVPIWKGGKDSPTLAAPVPISITLGRHCLDSFFRLHSHANQRSSNHRRSRGLRSGPTRG